MPGLRARLAHALDRRFAALGVRVDAVRTEIDAERARTEDLTAAVGRIADELGVVRERVDARVLPLLRAVAFEDAELRRRLDALRDDPDYEAAWTDPDPLVTVCISAVPERVELLAGRALPSALAQTHPDVEVVVVGDGFDPLADPRLAPLAGDGVRFGMVTQRMVQPGARREWLTAATLASNEARRMARGRWLTELDDDDVLRPGAVAALLAHARTTQAEVTYGLIERHDPAGAPGEVLGGFPPEPIGDWDGPALPYWRGRASSAALVHSGLRFIGRRHVSGDLGVPGDQFLVEQMVRAGVRFAFVDDVVYDYFPGGPPG